MGDTLLAISVVFSYDIVLNLNEKIKKKKNQKKTFTVGPDKTVGRTRTSKQFFGGPNGYGWLFMAYNFKIWWVGAYRGMGSYWNEYGTYDVTIAQDGQPEMISES